MILYHSSGIFIIKYFVVKNYLIKETQLQRIMEVINLEKELTLGQAMRIILSTLKENGYEDEQVVDFMIALRTNDPFIEKVSKKYELDPLFKSAVDRLRSSV